MAWRGSNERPCCSREVERSWSFCGDAPLLGHVGLTLAERARSEAAAPRDEARAVREQAKLQRERARRLSGSEAAAVAWPLKRIEGVC